MSLDGVYRCQTTPVGVGCPLTRMGVLWMVDDDGEDNAADD